MTDILAGLMMMGGGGLMLASAVPIGRSRPIDVGELVAALPWTPVPRPDPSLDALVTSID